MTIRRIAVLSGIDNRVLERVEPILKSQQIQPIANKSKMNEDNYYSVLLGKLIKLIDKEQNKDCKYIILLASCAGSEKDISLESKVFFPLVRRLGLPAQWRADINRHVSIAQSISKTFTSDDFKNISHEFRKPINDVYLLPYLNTGLKIIETELRSIYNLQSHSFSTKFHKHVTKIRNSGKLRINGLDFKGVLNGENHPVRRCSLTAWCDAAAQFRLGFQISSRFEFDVTCETKLDGKSFSLCDMTSQRIPAGVDHLNMRINGDFKF